MRGGGSALVCSTIAPLSCCTGAWALGSPQTHTHTHRHTRIGTTHGKTPRREGPGSHPEIDWQMSLTWAPDHVNAHSPRLLPHSHDRVSDHGEYVLRGYTWGTKRQLSMCVHIGPRCVSEVASRPAARPPTCLFHRSQPSPCELRCLATFHMSASPRSSAWPQWVCNGLGYLFLLICTEERGPGHCRVLMCTCAWRGAGSTCVSGRCPSSERVNVAERPATSRQPRPEARPRWTHRRTTASSEGPRC